LTRNAIYKHHQSLATNHNETRIIRAINLPHSEAENADFDPSQLRSGSQRVQTNNWHHCKRERMKSM
jgi:hypothetical protein